MLKIIYENTNISPFVDISECIHHDAAAGRLSSLDIAFDGAITWDGWAPKRGDTVQVELNEYSTGIMYVRAPGPDDGLYRITAASATDAILARAWASFENRTLGQIMRAMAVECGMEWGLYGVSESRKYDYILRNNESCALFLSRLLTAEGATLKCDNGKLLGIGLAYAAGLPIARSLEIAPDQSAFRQTAPDEICLDLEFDPAIRALSMVEITGGSQAGVWMVTEAEHDLVEERTRATLRRCF